MKGPLFSIVVPSYNRPRRLVECLDALVGLDYPHDQFEVVVADDGSHVSLEEAALPYRARLPLTLVTQAHAGPAAARNAGAARARGHFLTFTDDDCAPSPDWLQILAARFAKRPDCMIGGRTVNLLQDNAYATASQRLVDYLYVYYNRDPNAARFITSNNMALPAKQFHAIGGFDIGFPVAGGEDRELCDRWLYHGYGMIYAPEAVIHHAHALTFRGFLRQHLNYGRGAFHYHLKRSRRDRAGVRPEPSSFYLNLLRYPLSGSGWVHEVRLKLLLVCSQIANALGYFLEKRNCFN